MPGQIGPSTSFGKLGVPTRSVDTESRADRRAVLRFQRICNVMLTAETSERRSPGFDPPGSAGFGALGVATGRFIEYRKVLRLASEARHELVVCIMITGGLGIAEQLSEPAERQAFGVLKQKPANSVLIGRSGIAGPRSADSGGGRGGLLTRPALGGRRAIVGRVGCTQTLRV